MVFFHPVYLLIALASVLILSFIYFGARRTLKSLTWQLPFVAIIALVNPLFSAQGLTEIFRIGEMAIYAEALLYGLFMGIMLITMLIAFSCANIAISHEGFMSVLASKLPTITLMISMAARLVPSLKRKAASIRAVQNACTAANSVASKKGSDLRLVTVLMGWSMEDSLVMADSMKIAGWSNNKRRTTYSIYRFKKRDVIAITFICILALLSVIFAIEDCSRFSFYPTVSGLSFSLGQLDFALFALLPAFFEVINEV